MRGRWSSGWRVGYDEWREEWCWRVRRLQDGGGVGCRVEEWMVRGEGSHWLVQVSWEERVCEGVGERGESGGGGVDSERKWVIPASPGQCGREGRMYITYTYIRTYVRTYA